MATCASTGIDLKDITWSELSFECAVHTKLSALQLQLESRIKLRGFFHFMQINNASYHNKLRIVEVVLDTLGRISPVFLR